MVHQLGGSRIANRRKLTKSSWGVPPTRLYDLIRRLTEIGGRRVAVIGCSDGRFVLPFARIGIRVKAIDVDPVALWGGVKQFPQGYRPILGLAGRLDTEGLRELVDIREVDLAILDSDPVHDLVFTSGSIHYSRNRDTPVVDLIARLVSQAKPKALIYIDYMLPVEKKHTDLPHYMKPGALRSALESLGCTILYDHYSGLLQEKAHVDNPVDHCHRLGYVLAKAPNVCH